MEHEFWLGSEASYQVVQKYLTQFTHTDFNKEAFHRSPYDRDQPVLDDVFGVDDNRIGLTLLRKIGDQVILQVAGSLVTNFSRWHVWFRGESVSYEAIRDALAICEETGVKDLIMVFDSSGGTVRGLSETAEAMKRFQRSGGKIRSHSSSLVASAAYWLYCGGNECTAAEMAEVGSIGTMAVIRTMVNTEQTMGLKFTVIKAGKWKALGNPFEELTEEVKKRLQQNIDETNEFFLKRVSVQRNLMISETDVWAEGQVFFAEKARQVGLIDKITTLDDLIDSGPAANNPSETRRFDMEISAEKLAQIAAGADPKTVLTAAELELYMANLKNTEEEPAPTPEVKAETGEPAKKEPVEPAPQVSMSDELRKALKDLGSVEAKLEARDGELAKLQEANEAMAKSMESLLVVAQSAIGNLQVALRKPRETKASVTEVLAQYNDLQSQMAKAFPTGQQSSHAKTEDDQPNVHAGNVDYRLRHGAPKQTGR